MRGRTLNALRAAALAGLIAAAGVLGVQAAPGQYLSVDEFLSGAFDGAEAEAASVTVDAELRVDVESVLDRAFSRLRLRYWRRADTTAWILDEIGKTEPITIGVAVEQGRVKSVRILEFRESRGYEVRYPFFTDQFSGAGLTPESRLDRSIHGITGATLSVTAVDKVVRAALLLDREVNAARADLTQAKGH